MLRGRHASLLIASALLASPPVAGRAGEAPSAADLRRGQLLFLQCRACHALGTETEGKVGPPLGGVMGRQAAAAPGFTYSTALAGAGLTWDEATLDRWLQQPTALVPGTSMVYAGLAKPEDRRQLIAYLRQATAAR
ncbi:MAG: cytochrome c family protein [Steroidobacteraceae bacterium]|jgi:cytochrome c|nr:cytochrome c family protein [Steroidobacteraceae bacterium]